MKVDELFKHLNNIKIDETKLDEESKIAEYLAQEFNEIGMGMDNFMLRNKKIYDIYSYDRVIRSNKISPDDAYVYLSKFIYTRNDHVSIYDVDVSIYKIGCYYPFLPYPEFFEAGYLSKLGFHRYIFGIVPATGLKYIARVYHFLDVNHLVIEVANINTVIINLNLPILSHSILAERYAKGLNYVSDDQLEQIVKRLKSQKLFAGYNFREAEEIIKKYYNANDTSLAKDVAAIRNAYNRIFQPFRIEYDLKTKQFQVSGNNEDR